MDLPIHGGEPEILVVEDSLTYTSILKKNLVSWGLSFRVCADGIEAWDYFDLQRPKLVILNWHLPGMSGIDICRKIREIDDDRYVYIIMLTSMDEQEDIVAGFEAGVDDYVTKPFKPELFRARIEVGLRILKLQNDVRETRHQLVDSARMAGMAEMATGVLHNAGNILTTAMTATSSICEILEKSKMDTLGKLALLMVEQKDHFERFVNDDLRGKHLPDMIIELNRTLRKEFDAVFEKIRLIDSNFESLLRVIDVQLLSAGGSVYIEAASMYELVKDAISLNEQVFQTYGIEVTVGNDLPKPVYAADKHKVLQILLNLLKNAGEALKSSDVIRKRIAIRLRSVADNRVRVEVRDNGVGMNSTILSRLFEYGFTTKPKGHGFGLHHSANLAKEMGGSLSARSEGAGSGATFHLVLPVKEALS